MKKGNYKDAHSALLPEILSAQMTKFKTKSLERHQTTLLDITVDNMEKKIEYIHEEYNDVCSNGKWTIFNKHAIPLDE